MILYTNGCSWTFGNGTSEDINFDKTKNLSDHAWPIYLGNLIGNNTQVVNESLGAASNARIVRMTSEFLMTFPKDCIRDLIIVIGWTTSERSEIFVEEEENRGWFCFNSSHPFEDTVRYTGKILNRKRINNISKFQKLYIENVYSTYGNMLTAIQQKYLLTNLLENLGIRYIFFDSLPVVWDATLDRDYRGRLDSFRTKNHIDEIFFHYCNNHNLPMSSCMHPMIDAHKEWAGVVFKKYKELYESK